MLRIRVSRLRNVQKWEVPLRKGVDLSDAQESRIQFAKRTEMGSVFLQEGRFADVQEWRFHGAKRSKMGTAVQQ